jgi:cytochrome c biogenesis protein CcdA
MVNQELWKFLSAIFKLFYNISFIILTGVIIYLGIVYITAGKDEVIKKVHERWLLLIVGVVLIFFSLTIPSVIQKFFNP